MNLPFELIACLACHCADHKLPDSLRQAAVKAERLAGLADALHQRRALQERDKRTEHRFARSHDNVISRRMPKCREAKFVRGFG